jgi:fucose permease
MIRLPVITIAGFLVMGVGGSALGVAWPAMSDTLGRSISELGVLFVATGLTHAASSLYYGALWRRYGTGPLLAAGCLLTVGWFIVFTTAGSWLLILLSSLVGGLGFGLMDTGLNVHWALEGDQRVMNLGHAGYGVGATAGPLLMTAVLGTALSWRLGFLILAALNGAMLLTYAATTQAWPSTEPAPEEADTAASPRLPLRLLLGSSALFILDAGLEFASGQWAFSLFTESRGLSDTTAGMLVTAYWGVYAACRILLGLLGTRLASTSAVTIGAVTAATGTVLLWWAPAAWIGGLGLTLIGAGLAPIFPAMILLTPGRVGTHHTATAVGVQFASVSVGMLLLPAGMGLVVEWFGLEAIPLVLVAAACALVVGAVLTFQFGDRRKPEPAQCL